MELSRRSVRGVPDNQGPRTLVAVLTVEGETFEVSERDGQYEYDWVDGRHHGDYGFVSKPSDGLPLENKEDHQETIESFLADINPETGFLD